MLYNIFFSENQELVTLISFPFFFIDAFICMLFFTFILDLKVSNKQKFTYVFILSITCYICRTFILNPYGIILNMIVWPLYVLLIFKTNLLKAFLSEVIPYSFSAILELFFSKFLLVMTNTPTTSLLNIPFYRLLIPSLVYSSIYILYKICKKLNFTISSFENIHKKEKILLIINCVLALLTVFLQFYLLNYYGNKFPLLISLFNILSLLAYFIITLVNFINTVKLNSTSMSLEETQLSYKTLELLYDNTRAFKHDFANILDGFGVFADTNNLEGFKKYYQQLLEDYDHVNNLTSLNPKIINNHPIYILLANKYHRADEMGIKINLDVFIDLNELNIKTYDFTRILGILLDNAIEATNECNDKLINISFRENKHQCVQQIIIKNTYINKNLNICKIYEKNYTTKPQNTGIGLWEVKKIIKKNNNLKLNTSINKDFFIQQFEIHY